MDNPFYMPPEPEPVQSRRDEFDLAAMPPGQGDMNYRPPVILADHQSVWMLRDMVLISLAAFPCGFLFRDLAAAYLLDQYIFLLVLLFGFTAGLVQPLRQASGPDDSVDFRIVAWFCTPVLLWGTIALAGYTRTWAGGILYLAILPIPLTLVLADQLATHAVWWMSANPRLDLATMLAWRNDWTHRFLDPPTRPPGRKDVPSEVLELHAGVLRTKTSYRWAILFLAAGVGAALVFARGFSKSTRPFDFGFSFFLGLLLVLLLICFCRTWHLPAAFGIFWRFFMIWVYDRPDPNTLPWSFRSPTLAIVHRLRLVLACVFLWSIALAMITDHFAWFFFLDSHPRLRPQLAANFWTADGPFIFLSVRPALSFSLVYIVAAVAGCIVFPILVFFLVLFLVTGPVLAGHFIALESADAYEQR